MFPRLAPPALLLALVLTATACTTTGGDAPTSTTGSLPAPAAPTTTTTGGASTTTTTSGTATTTSTATAPSPTGPAFITAPCEMEVPEDRIVDCGWLEVPADRSDPASGTIRLHVAVFRSDDPDPAPDPVVYLEGGPGGDSLELVPLIFEEAFAHLLADHDVIFYDQRGTGYSEPSLACPELRELGFELLDDDLPLDELLGLQLDAIVECRDRLVDEGADLDAYSSANSAADLADLRVALGLDEWNLYGISYGTRLALTTMRDHPAGIRSVVLDSAYPPSVDIISEAPANLDRALGKLFDGCAADAACAAAYPELEATFYELLSNLEENPLRAPVTDVFTGEVYDAVFDGAAFGSVVFQSLYSDEAITVLPLLVDNVAAGETYELSLLTTSFLVNGEYVSAGMQLSVQCQEEAGFTSPEAVAAGQQGYPELEPIFAGSANVGSPVFDVCALWDVGQAPPLENEPIRSSIPTLVLAGEYDPITPPDWGRQAAATLEGSVFVEFPGQGHGPSAADECPQEILRAFLAAPGEPVDASCTTAMGPPAFVTPDTPVPPVELVPYTEELFGAAWSGLVPDGWERQDVGVWTRALSGLDQTTIVQQFATGASPGLLVATLGAQFGLGDDPQPVAEQASPAGTWVLYDGLVAGVPATLALLDAGGGAAIVILIAAPTEIDQLRADVLLPALDAFVVG